MTVLPKTTCSNAQPLPQDAIGLVAEHLFGPAHLDDDTLSDIPEDHDDKEEEEEEEHIGKKYVINC
jgi:hypothetical protein